MFLLTLAVSLWMVSRQCSCLLPFTYEVPCTSCASFCKSCTTVYPFIITMHIHSKLYTITICFWPVSAIRSTTIYPCILTYPNYIYIYIYIHNHSITKFSSILLWCASILPVELSVTFCLLSLEARSYILASQGLTAFTGMAELMTHPVRAQRVSLDG